MIPGAIGTPPSCSADGPTVIPYTTGPAAGNAVYDCNTKYTWAADGNMAASNAYRHHRQRVRFPLPPSRTITAPKISNGAMLFDTATQWMQAMNNSQYLGSSAWQIPATAAVLKDLFTDLGLESGDSRLMATGAAGPFQNLQPFYYWGCQRDQSGTSQSPCTGYAPGDLQWTFNFDAGFQPTSSLVQHFFVMVYYPVTATTGPLVSLVANAEGEATTIAPNTWVEIKGSNLAPPGDSRIWQDSDFVNNKLPTQLDGVSVTVNGRSAYVYYISPTQINILTPPDALSAEAQIVVSNNGAASAQFTALAQPLSPSFFVFSDGLHVAAIHADGTLVGPASFSAPGYTFSPGQARRNDLRLRERLRPHLDSRGRRIHDARRNAVSTSGDHDCRPERHGSVRRTGLAGRVPVQCDRSRPGPARRSDHQSDLRWHDHAARHPPDDHSLISPAHARER